LLKFFPRQGVGHAKSDEVGGALLTPVRQIAGEKGYGCLGVEVIQRRDAAATLESGRAVPALRF
jgi:hypothetical protein